MVRVPTNHRKTLEIERILASKKLKKKNKERLETQLREARRQKETMKNNLETAFKNYYDFSEVILMYDTAMIHLKNGIRANIFLTDLSPQFFENKPVYTLRYGYTDVRNTTGIEAWILTNAENEDLVSPFPYYISAKNLTRKLPSDTLVPEEQDAEKEISQKGSKEDKIALRLNRKLWKYYNKQI